MPVSGTCGFTTSGTCATLLLLEGVELKVVQEILGHASISTTGTIYAQVLQGLKRAAADSMDAALLGANAL